MRSILVLSCLLLPSLSGCVSVDRAQEPAPGVVVRSMKEFGGGFKVGVEVGDRLVRWSRTNGVGAPRTGVFSSVFDFKDVSYEEGQRARVTVSGWRSGEPIEFELEAPWAITVRPWLDDDLLERYLAADSDAEALAGLADLAGTGDQDAVLAAWFRYRSGRIEDDEEVAEGRLQGLIDSTLPLTVRSWAAHALGRKKMRQRDPEAAVTAFLRSRDFLAEGGEDRLLLARALYGLGMTEASRWRLEQAADWFEESLRITERQAPDSVTAAGVYKALGTIAARRTRGPEGTDHYD